MNIEDYDSMKKWFIKPDGERRYEPGTEKEYVKYAEAWCQLTGKTLDELADSPDIDKMRGMIAEGFRKKYHLGVRSLEQRVNALNRFWQCNGRRTKETYGGIPDDIMYFIKREKKKSYTET